MVEFRGKMRVVLLTLQGYTKFVPSSLRKQFSFSIGGELLSQGKDFDHPRVMLTPSLRWMGGLINGENKPELDDKAFHLPVHQFSNPLQQSQALSSSFSIQFRFIYIALNDNNSHLEVLHTVW